MKKLTVLNVSNNFLLRFPLLELPNLNTLDVSVNTLEYICVGRLSKLELLKLDNNKLEQFPFGLQFLSQNLELLSISGNPLTLLPQELGSLVRELTFARSTTVCKKAMQYVCELHRNGVFWNRHKCVVLGKEASGKVPNLRLGIFSSFT